MKHAIKSSLLKKRVEVALVGCGGSGSLMLGELPRIDKAMRGCGHPHGLHVTVYDPDTVSASNLARQNFYEPDLGQFKAYVLVDRVNKCYGTDWDAVPGYFDSKVIKNRPDIIIGCVDTAASRRMIDSYAKGHGVEYWLDAGNGLSTGQVILGEPLCCNPYYGRKIKDDPMRLPTITDLFPELLDASITEDDSTPTCSLAEALERQDLMICRSVVTQAAHLLWTLFRKGGVDHHGSFINLNTGMVTPLAVDPAAWERFKPLKKKRASRKKAVAA